MDARWLFSRVSIKWKISFSFVILTLAVVGLYVAMASQVFESDKISYIFDSEQVKVTNLAKQIEHKIEMAHFRSRSILGGFDFATKSLGGLSENLFKESAEIQAMEIYDSGALNSLLRLEKKEGILPAFETSEGSIQSGNIEIRNLSPDRYLIYSIEAGQDGGGLVLRVVVDLPELLPPPGKTDFLLSQGTKVLAERSDTPNFSKIGIQIADELNMDRAQKTTFMLVGDQRFLVSSAPVRYSDLQVISVIDEERALGALGVLFRKSLVFLAFSSCATIVISLLLSSGLTKSLQILAAGAARIGRGDFSSVVDVPSRDEIGLLSSAFTKMSGEIQRLLVETKDKARMEAELKTAKLVQESLFPASSDYGRDGISISGLFLTSSECGGDWWYYFDRGENTYLVVADATGHGTPAALITSAARAVFTQLESTESSLEKMMTDWNKVISACSNRTVYMTAMIMQIHRPTGKVQCINASHEPPLHFVRESGAYTGEPLIAPVSPRLGETQQGNWQIFEFNLNVGDRMIVYTDGLTGIENSEGKVLGERRALKAIQKVCDESQNAKEFNEKVFGIFEKHRAGHPLNDDVTLIVLERRELQDQEIKKVG